LESKVKETFGMAKNDTIAFDFDGVIAKYEGFKGEEHEEEPQKEVVEAIRRLKAEGCTVIIFSTRSDEFLRQYCEKHNIPVDYFNDNPDVTNPSGKPVAQVYVDDKTVLYRGQKADQLVEQVLHFKSFWDDSGPTIDAAR
jgi:hydroxymethylpyrimidine pyrophosphatase-like HAD family hydrolase